MVGKNLNANLRKNDLLARIGGDEFVLMLPGLSLDQAKTTIPEIFEMLNRAMWENNKNTTFSVGAVTFVQVPKSVKDAVQEADRLMYHAKTNGKNNFILKLSTNIKT